jgi:hypothetical protein
MLPGKTGLCFDGHFNVNLKLTSGTQDTEQIGNPSVDFERSYKQTLGDWFSLRGSKKHVNQLFINLFEFRHVFRLVI